MARYGVEMSRVRARVERGVLWLFAGALILVPSSVRERIGAELRRDFRERQREAAGAFALVRVWLRELGGLFVLAWRSRRGDPWMVRVDEQLGLAPVAGGVRRREARVPALWDRLRRDVRFAARSIGKRPGAAALVVATFGLGVAASTSIYSVADAVLLRGLPYPSADRLVSVYVTFPEWRTVPGLEDVWNRASFSYPEYEDWHTRQRSFELTAAFTRRFVTVSGGGGPERVRVGRATASLFPLLGVRAALGRTFATGEDDRVDAVVVLSHGFWQRRFGGDPGVVGRTVRLSDVPHTVVGVLPEDFRLVGFESEAWTPLGGPADERMRENHGLRVIGRLAAGVTLEAAQTETARLLGAAAADHGMHSARLVPRAADVTAGVRQPLMLLLFAAGLLLAVSCVSVAAVQLGAGIDRESELTVRAALGATRGRLASQLLTESVVLAVAGGTLGLLLARLGLDALVGLAPSGIPRLEEVGLDARIVALAIAVSAACGVAFGLVPAVALARVRPASGNRVSGGRARLQSGIVMAEVALATVLLVGAGLLTRTMVALGRVDPGFRTEGLLTVRVAHDMSRFAQDSTGERLTAYIDEIADALRGLPGVRDVAVTSVLPYSEDRAVSPPVEGPTSATAAAFVPERHFVSWNYLEVAGIPLVRGRGFLPRDDRRDAEPVTIVSERLAARLWPDGEAIGRTLAFPDANFRVIGVAADVRDRDLTAEAGLAYWVPRRPFGFGDGSFVLRVDGEPAALAPAVRARIGTVDPELPVTEIAPMRERVSESIAEERYRMRLIGVFAVLAAVFALLGVYGVASRWVARRTRELGIRMAIGAERGRVLALVVGHGLRLTLAGALAGIALSLAFTRVLESFLFGVRPNDALTVAAIALLLLALALLATAAPARRAARIDPATALRAD